VNDEGDLLAWLIWIAVLLVALFGVER